MSMLDQEKIAECNDGIVEFENRQSSRFMAIFPESPAGKMSILDFVSVLNNRNQRDGRFAYDWQDPDNWVIWFVEAPRKSEGEYDPYSDLPGWN